MKNNAMTLEGNKGIITIFPHYSHSAQSQGRGKKGKKTFRSSLIPFPGVGGSENDA